MKAVSVKDLFSFTQALLGRTSNDHELRSILEGLGKWPIPAFGPEELTLYLADKSQGFCLVFDDGSTVKHAVAAGKGSQTPIFVGGFFYAEGVDEYHAFSGTLPNGIVWSDSASSLLSKMGPPKHEITNKKTGALSSHRWPLGQWMLTARYAGGGSSIKHLHLGLF